MPLDYRVAFCIPTEFDKATLGGGSWVNTDTVKLDNLKDRRIKKVARSTDATSANTRFTVDALAAVTWDCFNFAHVNWTSAVTLQISADANAANLFTTPTFATSALNPWPGGTKPTDTDLLSYHIHFYFGDQTFRHWGVRIVDTANPDGYVQMGRAYPCKAKQLSGNYSPGLERGFNPADIHQPTPFGGTLLDDRLKPREGMMPFSYASLADAEDEHYELTRLRGNSKDLFLIMDPEDTARLHRKMFPVAIKPGSGVTKYPGNDWYQFQIGYRELLS